ncbi:MAG: hypothetical protein KAX50_09275 [Saprospiraceae bacterium]|nr:hypothetical protein [Saprospiraceae bacterium]
MGVCRHSTARSGAVGSSLTPAVVSFCPSHSTASTANFTAKHEALPQKDTVTRKDRPADTTPAPLREGIDYYLENGRYVFTEYFLRQRGYCCQSGCRHCPYGFQKTKTSTRE